MQIKPLRINNAIITLCAITVLLLSMVANAQEIDSFMVTPLQSSAPIKTGIEFFAGGGIDSWDELFDGATFNILGPSAYSYNVKKYSGAFSGGVKFFFNKVALNLAFAYEKESGIWQETNTQDHFDDWQTQQIGTFSHQAFTFAPEVTFIYEEVVEKGITFRSYGSVGMGITYVKETDVPNYNGSGYFPIQQVTQVYNGIPTKFNWSHFNMQVTPFGYEIGGKLKWFLELGIGYKGMINTGLTWKVR